MEFLKRRASNSTRWHTVGDAEANLVGLVEGLVLGKILTSKMGEHVIGLFQRECDAAYNKAEQRMWAELQRRENDAKKLVEATNG